MVGYITLGTNDFKSSAKFYDQLFQVIGIDRLWATEDMIAWGGSRGECALCITAPFNGKPATAGNGAMVALKLDSQEEVKLIYAKALELGGQDEGEPGLRGSHGFYGGYFRDLDGNKMNAYVPSS